MDQEDQQQLQYYESKFGDIDIFGQLETGFIVNEIQGNGLDVFQGNGFQHDVKESEKQPAPKIPIIMQKAASKQHTKRNRALSLPESVAIVDRNDCVQASLRQLKQIDLTDITVTELKNILRQYGLAAQGKKVELVARLCEYRNMLKAKTKHI